MGNQIPLGLSSLLWLFLPILQLGITQGDTIELAIISENITIDAGESALLVCVGFNSDNSSVDITWMRNGEVISSSSSPSIVLTTEDLVHRNRLFKQSFLQLCEMQHVESGTYSCIVSNDTNSVNASVDVTVNNVIDLAVLSNSSTQQVGDSILLICAGHGQPSINVSWTKDGQVISNSSDMQITEANMVLGGRVFTHSYLRLCSLQTCHSGIYNCSVDNGISTKEGSISVTVEGDSPAIANVSNEIQISSGESAQLVCVGYPAEHVDITWTYKDVYISNASGLVIREEISRAGKKSILEYSSMKQQDAGIRMCTVSNGCQSASSFVSVRISQSSPGNATGTFSLYTIIGIIVAAIVVLLVIIAIIVVAGVCTRKHKKEVSDQLANKQGDGAVYEEICKNGNYEEVGKGSVLYDYTDTKPTDYDLDTLQTNSAYGVVPNSEHVYMDASKL